MHVRRRLHFQLDWNELGFAKLKDLIMSMTPQVRLELRGHNHPFVFRSKDNEIDQQPRKISDISQKSSESNSDKPQLRKDNSPHIVPDKTDDDQREESPILLNKKIQNIESDVKQKEIPSEQASRFQKPEELPKVLSAFFNLLKEFPVGFRTSQLQNLLS
jgi:hypothetical protein